jgi:hypothetical protein
MAGGFKMVDLSSPPRDRRRYPPEIPTRNGELSMIATRHASPILCPTGVIFADALRQAISLGGGEDYFWVVSLDSASDGKLWIQFTDCCINVTDLLPSMTAADQTFPSYITKVDRRDGLYTVLSYSLPPPIEFLAATSCQYLHTRFAKPLINARWDLTIYKSALPRR